MKCDQVVTIWHFDNPEIKNRMVFKNVCLEYTRKIDKNGIKQKGFFNADNAIVRIFTEEDIYVLPGDYLFIGENFDEFPPADSGLKIIEVKDNRYGGQKHWRITCGG